MPGVRRLVDSLHAVCAPNRAVERQIVAEENSKIRKGKNGTDEETKQEQQKKRQERASLTTPTKKEVEICRKS